MWIVFGWDEETRPLGEVGTGYCYDCRRSTGWIVWKESEWVTFSDIRVLRFVCKYHLHCEGCTSVFPLTPREFRRINRRMKRHDSIDGTRLHRALMARIETEQLAGKTELQREFIRNSMAAEREYEAAIKAQNQTRD